jgi:hypothetical protein
MTKYALVTGSSAGAYCLHVIVFLDVCLRVNFVSCRHWARHCAPIVGRWLSRYHKWKIIGTHPERIQGRGCRDAHTFTVSKTPDFSHSLIPVYPVTMRARHSCTDRITVIVVQHCTGGCLYQRWHCALDCQHFRDFGRPARHPSQQCRQPCIRAGTRTNHPCRMCAEYSLQ